ncbi:HTH domain-containing protein [Haloarchaeobius salinus]|uniref:HTH domain-containing protein n=1 Tax=Haloarchaeobius salinus TaxID=1198298 RepID=UPI00210A92CD|nr:HTH domain-containing protein [Haloarchaeobius salinus]
MTSQFDTHLDNSSLTVELFVCASMYGTYEKQNDVIQRIERLADRGVVDEFERHTWTRRLSPAAEDTWCEFAREKYAEFTRWAELSDRTLEPAFTRRSITNEFVGEHYEVIQFPILSIAIYADDRLVRLSPSVDGDGVAYTIEDSLSELERLAEQPVHQPQHVPEP